MAQIQAGITYTDGGQVTASNLNAHVNNAVLVPGAISTQSAATTCTVSDGLLILQGGALKQATVSQLPFINKDGSVAMTGELTLSSSTPVASLAAASKSYVDTGLATKQASIGYTPVNKAGDTGVGPLALSVDPVSALQVTTKQYVDTGLATKQASLGFTPVNKTGDTMTGILTLSAGPVNALDASTKAYVDAQVVAAGPGLVPAGAVMAFYRSTPPTGWIECNGQSAAAYPNLVAIGVITTPDLRGEFVRGWDNGRGVDPGRALGTSQADAFQGHYHNFYSDSEQTTNGGGGRSVRGKNFLQLSGTVAEPITDGSSGTPRTASETRPKNIALMYCIKT